MKLTKSLFVEYVTEPKLAWWHVNSKKDIYHDIMDARYGDMDGVAIGQTVEDAVKELYDAPIATVNTEGMRDDRHGTYHQRSMQLLKETDDATIIYQPSFFVDDMFVKCDFLVPNGEGQYDLIEVKSKTTVRKKTKAAPLLEELQADLSVQRWVLQRALGDKFSGRCFLVYLDKEYVKDGQVDHEALLVQEELTDELLEDAQVTETIKQMKEELVLGEEEFNQRHPYDGSDYLSYFGEQPPKQSLWSVKGLSAKKKALLYGQGKTDLDEFTPQDMEVLTKRNGDPSTASEFVELWQQGEEVVDNEAIEQALAQLDYPLYFYDYETINWPIPLFEGTSPWQQVVVQYSLHKMHHNGEISHHEAILQPDESHNERLLQQMIDDMDGVQDGTFIVWYKGFENRRNTERGELFPDYQAPLERINQQTFDLMEIFSNQLYFHRDFEGSASIKKVLPVLTDISYEDLAISNGGAAAQKLLQTLTGQITGDELAKTQQDLLAYCKQDTRAMVALWRQLQARLSD